MENNLPHINIISASSSSESGDSSSIVDDELYRNMGIIEKIEKTHKTLQQKLTYQIMQFRSSSRMLINDTPAPTPPADEELGKKELDTEGGSEDPQEILKVFSEFRKSQKDLCIAKSDVEKIESEYEDLRDKLRQLEERVIEKRNRRLVKGGECGCSIC